MLPKISGIYLFYDKHNEIIYVGRTKNIKKRIKSHLSSRKYAINQPRCLIDKNRNIIKKIRFIECPKNKIKEMESCLINFFKPCFNIKNNWYQKQTRNLNGTFCSIIR